MIRLMRDLGFVIAATLIGGMLGGYAGYQVGRWSPCFVTELVHVDAPRTGLHDAFNPAEFGLGLGMVCGLFLGVGSGLILVVCGFLRDAWDARLKVSRRMMDLEDRSVSPQSSA
jgi:hypothetical protein